VKDEFASETQPFQKKTGTNSLASVYTGIARRYELVNHVLTLGMDMLWRKKAARIAYDGGGALWLDLCSGTGEMAANLLELAGSDVTIIAADFSGPMLQEAAKEDRYYRIQRIVSDASSLPFPDETFDLAVVSFAVRNLAMTGGALDAHLLEIRRILKPGGRLVTLETSQPPPRLVRILFHFYVRRTVGWVGCLLSGSRGGYKYLTTSIIGFHGAGQFAGILKKNGFSGVKIQMMFFGAAAIHSAVRGRKGGMNE
jgi:demethylmenaquinone methyltransferase/2-methoxy-6-polyprenyl-1,4-benzoquinol methylase